MDHISLEKLCFARILVVFDFCHMTASGILLCLDMCPSCIPCHLKAHVRMSYQGRRLYTEEPTN